MAGRDVVITGMGLTTPLGRNVSENWAGVRAQKSGITFTPRDNIPEYLQYRGSVASYSLPGDIPPKQLGQVKFLNRGAALGLCAAAEAAGGSRNHLESIEPGRRALFVASGDHTQIGYEFMYPAISSSVDTQWQTMDAEKLNDAALSRVNPFFLLDGLNNNLFSFLSAYLEFMGPSTSLASHSPYGGNALELACRSIRQDRADAALAAGYGSWINDLSLYELEGLGILSRCTKGISSFRTFDRTRDGFIAGEGGAALLLESAESAREGGRTVLGRIIETENCINFSEQYTFSIPERVIERILLSSLESASTAPDELAFIIPHGSGTKKGDRSELNSLLSVFRKKRSSTPVCGLKPYTGHLGAASDITEIILGILAMKDRIVPATLNFEKTEEQFSSLAVSGTESPCSGNRFLSVSYGVGGQASSVIVEAG